MQPNNHTVTAPAPSFCCRTLCNTPASAMSRSVAVAVYSHFGPGKFPANWWTVAFCVATYVVINVVLVIFSSIKEGDSFLVTHPKPVRGRWDHQHWRYQHQQH